MGKLDIGATILERRKALDMTQRQLADLLNVTDKAVSKWERGQGYPDITMLNDLATALQVSVGELMRGAIPAGDTDNPVEVDVDTVVDNTLEYADKLITRARGNRAGARLIISGACFTAIAVCLIVDLAVNQSMTWSWIVVAGVTTGWAITVPLLPFTKGRVLIAVGVATVAVPVLLVVIHTVSPNPAENFWTLALPVVGMGLVGLWLLAFIFFYLRIHLLYRVALFLVSGGVLGFLINGSVMRSLSEDFPTSSDYITLISCCLGAVLSAISAAIVRIRQPDKEDRPPVTASPES